jgi:CHAT domain-containing protein
LSRAEEHQWASDRFLLGIALLEKQVAGQPVDLEPAITAFEEAITVWTPERSPRNWSRTKFNLGTCHLRRRAGLRSENVERAIFEYQDALTVASHNDWPEHWANIQDALGQAFRQRVLGDPAQNREQAIAHLQQALTVRSPERGVRAYVLSLNNLANAYLDRILGEPSDNVERALAVDRMALAAVEQQTDVAETDLLALVSQNLGLAYRDRLYGDPAEDRERAIRYIGQAIVIYEPEEEILHKASALVNLASVYLIERFRFAQTRQSDLDRAIEYLTVALGALDEQRSANVWAIAQVLLGQAYMERARFGPREETFHTAIGHLEASLRVRTRESDPLGWAQVLQTLGNVHSMRGDTDKGIEYYSKALEVYTLDLPYERRRTLKSIGHSWFERGQFEKALAAYRETIALGEDLLGISYTPQAKQFEAAELSTLYPNVAYSLLALGKPEEGLVMLERGKTRLLVQELSLSDVALRRLDEAARKRIESLRDDVRGIETLLIELMRDGREQDLQDVRLRLEQARSSLRSELGTSAEFLEQDLTLKQILELARPGECLVAPVITARGGAVFIIPSGAETIAEENIVWLDSAELWEMLHPAQPVYNPESRHELREWLHWYSVWRSDTSDETRKDRENFIDGFLQALWTGLMDHIHTSARVWGVTALLILPQGGLQLLPLHAAWRLEDGTRRYVMDDYVVHYAPSAWVLRQCRLRAAATTTRRALCIAVKRYKDFLHLRPLPFAHVEAREVARITEGKLLLDRKATAESVLENSPAFTHFHFACHATLSSDPLLVALQLGGYGKEPRDELPVKQIVAEMDLSTARLITLAACESGVVEHLHSADEYVGLPGALLQAGAAAVVSSLFMVHDLTSCLLWRAFYELHWGQQMEPAAALRAAQTWLRDLTSDELRSIADSWRADEPTAAEEALFAARVERPFSHPLLWSGFVYVGA